MKVINSEPLLFQQRLLNHYVHFPPRFLPCPRHGEELLCAQVLRVQSVEKVFEGDQSLGVHQASGDAGDLVSLNALKLQR